MYIYKIFIKNKTKPHPSNKVQFIVLLADVLSAFQHATQIKSFFFPKSDNHLFLFSLFFDIFVYLEGGKQNISDKRGSKTQKKHQTSTTLLSDRQRTLNKRWGRIGRIFSPVCWVTLRSGLWPKLVLSGWATTKMFFGHTMVSLQSDHITARAQTEWLQ